jgi:hypothetical protein
MKPIRRTALRALLGVVAAISLGLIGATAAAAQPVNHGTQTVATPNDLSWP